MKKARWIVLSALITIVVSGVIGYAAYNRGREAGYTEGLVARNNFIQARTGAAAGAPAAPGGATSSAGAASDAAQAARGAQATGGSQVAALGNVTMGQVKSANGNELEISTTGGEVVKVKLTDATQIQKTVAGTSTDLAPGETVVVQGAKGADGTVEARSIQVGAARMGFPGAPGRQGQGAQ